MKQKEITVEEISGLLKLHNEFKKRVLLDELGQIRKFEEQNLSNPPPAPVQKFKNPKTLEVLLNGLLIEGEYNAEIHSSLTNNFIELTDFANETLEALYNRELTYTDGRPEIPVKIYFDNKFWRNCWIPKNIVLFNNGFKTEFDSSSMELEDFEIGTQNISSTVYLDGFTLGAFNKSAKELSETLVEKEIFEGFATLVDIVSEKQPLEVVQPGQFHYDDAITLKGESKTTDLFISQELADKMIKDGFAPPNLVAQENPDVEYSLKQGFMGVNIYGVKGLEKGGALNKLFAQVGGWNPDEREIAIAVDGTQEAFLRAIKEVDSKTVRIYPVAENVDGEWKIGFKGETEQGFVFAGKGVSFLLI